MVRLLSWGLLFLMAISDLTIWMSIAAWRAGVRRVVAVLAPFMIVLGCTRWLVQSTWWTLPHDNASTWVGFGLNWLTHSQWKTFHHPAYSVIELSGIVAWIAGLHPDQGLAGIEHMLAVGLAVQMGVLILVVVWSAWLLRHQSVMQTLAMAALVATMPTVLIFTGWFSDNFLVGIVTLPCGILLARFLRYGQSRLLAMGLLGALAANSFTMLPITGIVCMVIVRRQREMIGRAVLAWGVGWLLAANAFAPFYGLSMREALRQAMPGGGWPHDMPIWTALVMVPIVAGIAALLWGFSTTGIVLIGGTVMTLGMSWRYLVTPIAFGLNVRTLLPLLILQTIALLFLWEQVTPAWSRRITVGVLLVALASLGQAVVVDARETRSRRTSGALVDARIEAFWATHPTGTAVCLRSEQDSRYCTMAYAYNRYRTIKSLRVWPSEMLMNGRLQWVRKTDTWHQEGDNLLRVGP